MANLKARKAEGKCVMCWQKISEATNVTRPSRWFQGELYHVSCWEKEYKKEKKAQGKLARTKRSF
jgi:hypothetical protein